MSFINCLLTKSNLNEAYFWISELYYSGFEDECWQLVWFVYYDFYFIHNPTFVSYLTKKHKVYKKQMEEQAQAQAQSQAQAQAQSQAQEVCSEDNNITTTNNHSSDLSIKLILTVVKNIFNMKSSHHVFILRQYNMDRFLKQEKSKISFKGKKPAWVSSFTKEYHTMLRCLKKKDYESFVMSLPDWSLSDDNDVDNDLIQNLKMYYSISDDIFHEINKKCFMVMDKDKDCYTNYAHILLAIICLFEFQSDILNSQYLSKKRLYLGCSDKEYETIYNIHNDKIPLNKYGNSHIYKTLSYKCLHSTHDNLYPFQLMRMVYNYEITDQLYYHWEYHAYHSPLWKKTI